MHRVTSGISRIGPFLFDWLRHYFIMAPLIPRSNKSSKDKIVAHCLWIQVQSGRGGWLDTKLPTRIHGAKPMQDCQLEVEGRSDVFLVYMPSAMWSWSSYRLQMISMAPYNRSVSIGLSVLIWTDIYLKACLGKFQCRRNPCWFDRLRVRFIIPGHDVTKLFVQGMATLPIL